MGQSSSRPCLDLIKSGAVSSVAEFLDEAPAGTVNEPTDERDDTLLHAACGCNQIAPSFQIATALLDRGANVNARNKDGCTPLHHATFVGAGEIVELLLRRGADPSIGDLVGMAPLHWAVRGAQFECVDLLLSYGADVSQTNKKSQTPIQLARALRGADRDRMRQRLVDGVKRRDETFSLHNRRLAGLCRCWGTIKYVHPFLGYRQDAVDRWDMGLVEAVQQVLSLEKFEEQQERSSSSSASIASSVNAAVESRASSVASYADILQRMLNKLNDPLTRCDSTPSSDQQLSSDATISSSSSTRDRHLPPVDLSPATSDHPPQPALHFTQDGIAVLSMTDFAQFNDFRKMQTFFDRFAQAKDKSKAIVFDLRDGNVCAGLSSQGASRYSSSTIAASAASSTSSSSHYTFKYMFLEAFRMFLRDTLPLPSHRQRVHFGAPEHFRGGLNIFSSGFATAEADSIPGANASSSSGGVDDDGPLSHSSDGRASPLSHVMVFIVNPGTPKSIFDVAVAAQNAKFAHCVFQLAPPTARHGDGQPTQQSSEHMSLEEQKRQVLLYDDDVINVQPDPSISGDLRVLIRRTERVNSDGSVGFAPDLIVPAPTLGPGRLQRRRGGGGGFDAHSASSYAWHGADDEAHHSACRILRSQAPLLARQLPRPLAYQARTRERDPFPAMLPPIEYRHLALFRLWASIRFSHPFCPADLDRVLAEAIPLIARADSALAYGRVLVSVISKLRDAQAAVSSPALRAALGSHVPALALRLVQNETVIVRIDTKGLPEGTVSAYSPLRVGDVILRIDGRHVADQRRRVADLIPDPGTPSAMEARVHQYLLAGPPDSQIRLKIRSGSSRSGVVSEVILPRTAPARLARYTNRRAAAEVIVYSRKKKSSRASSGRQPSGGITSSSKRVQSSTTLSVDASDQVSISPASAASSPRNSNSGSRRTTAASLSPTLSLVPAPQLVDEDGADGTARQVAAAANSAGAVGYVDPLRLSPDQLLDAWTYLCSCAWIMIDARGIPSSAARPTPGLLASLLASEPVHALDTVLPMVVPAQLNADCPSIRLVQQHTLTSLTVSSSSSRTLVPTTQEPPGAATPSPSTSASSSSAPSSTPANVQSTDGSPASNSTTSSSSFKGRVIILVSEDSGGLAETSVLYYLAARHDAILIGSDTPGASGSVSNLLLPGGVLVNFTALGVVGPGRGDQRRRSLHPRIQVEPTIAGLREGRDEVFDAALSHCRQNLSEDVKSKLIDRRGMEVIEK